jgi:hypothetical protein
MANDSEFVVANRTRCQHGRLTDRRYVDKCPARSQPGSIFCGPHLKEAMARVRLKGEQAVRGPG